MISPAPASVTPSAIWLPGMDPNAPLAPAAPPPRTLEAYLEQTFLPAAKDRNLSKDRIGELRQAVHRWKWWCERKYRIQHPVLSDLTPSRLVAFRRGVLDSEIPDKRGNPRLVTARSLNKTLQALEQILAAATEDGELDESRGVVRIKKVSHPRQINKLVLSDDELARILKACDTAADWPGRGRDGQPLDAPLLWRVAIAMFFNLGMRTQDLLRHEAELRPIRWSCVIPPGPSPAEDGQCESEYGWLYWIPNKTRHRKAFPHCLPLNATLAHWLGRLREAHQPADTDELMPIPWSKDSLYDQWRRLLAEAEVRPKPKRTIDNDGNVISTERSYLIKHLRCTAGTRADEHGASIGRQGVGRWITGHVSNDVFERHYRGMERAIQETLETIPQPAGIAPEQPTPPRLKLVG